MQIKLFNYSNNKFTLQAIIDDVQQSSFEHNYYAAGQFTITINYNIPNAKLFKRGLFVQFGDSPYDFGEITSITNSIGENGKGSEFVNITGYDARYLFKRRIISALNDNDKYTLTADGETCIRSLISSQCTGKRSLPVEMGTAGTLGETYTVSESYSNLYDVLQTVATQTNIGWRLKFSSGTLTLEVYQGEDKSKSVFFSEEMDSLKNGTYQDSNTSYANAILIAGKGSGSERDIYEGEELIDGDSPAGLDRFEAFDNQAELTTQEEYENEADAMLRQYGQTLTVQGAGLIKSPYVFREQYDIGDYITLSFSDKTAKVQITSVTEQISCNNKTLSFTFGKPVNGLDRQLDLMLKKIQSASSATSEASTNSVKWYTTPADTAQGSGDVTFNTLGFTGSGGTFTLYLDDEKTGSKSYHLYIKNLTGSLVLTTNKGATDLTLISGSYIANIFVDEDGNIINQGMTAINSVESGNTQPVTSGAVYDAISSSIGSPDVTNATGVLPIAHGGTDATTAKEAEYNLIGGVETVQTQPDDDRYIALRNQTVSASNGTFRWTKMSSVWAWIKSKISSVLGLDENNYGGTATNVTNVNITTSDSNEDFPLLFSANVTAGNKRVYTDTANNGSYNPSTNDMKISGNVLGSNLPYVSQVFSTSNYNSGYFLLAQLEGGATRNHDIGIIGSVVFGNTLLSSRKTDFEIFARGNAQTISITKFVVNGTAPIIATYEAVATNKFIIRLYGQISAYYQRFTTVINLAFIGDVYKRTSNRNVTFPNTRVTSLTGTQITKTNYPTLIETSAPSSPQNGQIWIS